MNRRLFLSAGLAIVLSAGCELSLREGLYNACRADLPPQLAAHSLVRAAWAGVDSDAVWDCHCHLFGNGDSGSGAWYNPALARLLNVPAYIQRLFFLNAGCVHDAPGRVDASVVDRLLNQAEALPAGSKLVLLAFDWARDESGAPIEERSTFVVPDTYAAAVAARYPQRFEWAASIHPYDPAAVDRLARAKELGARAVKWLPSAQNIDPASARCDRFYRAAAALRIPILTHAGDERAVRGHDESLGNPLRLRRALDLGVRVIVAHCASLGIGADLDAGGAPATHFALFTRLMETPSYDGLLFGDISAVTLGDRAAVLARLIERADWHHRLLNGSDYPLPGVLPLVGLDRFVERGLLDSAAVPVLREIREHNAILFDFVLKRSLRSNGHAFGRSVFETRALLTAA